jgi:hypothetical protein
MAVVVLGGGKVTSKPAGISCPGKCIATFAPGTRVVLAPTAKSGAPFLRWGGSCTGAGACRVKVSALSAVAAQFTAAHPPPTSPKSVAEPGTYCFVFDSSCSKTFFVSPGRRSVVNISIPLVRIACTPAASGAPDRDQILIAQTAIRPAGSFVGKATQNGVFAGSPANFTHSFTGNFHGRDARRATTAAGLFREDIVFADPTGTTHTCTSNDQPWTAFGTR